jgi:uncharacterized protein (UPF0548 family)
MAPTNSPALGTGEDRTLLVDAALRNQWPHQRFGLRDGTNDSTVVSFVQHADSPSHTAVLEVANTAAGAHVPYGPRGRVIVATVPDLEASTHVIVRAFKDILAASQPATVTAVMNKAVPSRFERTEAILSPDDRLLIEAILGYADVTDEDWYQHLLHAKTSTLFEDLVRVVVTHGPALAAAAGHRL